jgi:diadenosine tetraphosphate (Ap4A) HIT family hydrolase
VIPCQHIASYSPRDGREGRTVRLVSQAREQLQAALHPDAFTIGINDGVAAGQTVGHAHVHVISPLEGRRGRPARRRALDDPGQGQLLE